MKIIQTIIPNTEFEYRLCLVLIWLLIVGSSIGGNSTQYYNPAIDYLNVYQGAGYESRVIGQLMKNDLIFVCSSRDGWSQIVVTGKSVNGYSVSKFLTKSDYSPGWLNNNGLFSSGKGDIYRNGMWHYQSFLNEYSLLITIGCLIISVFMGVLLFKFFRKNRWSEGEWNFTCTEKLRKDCSNISAIHWYVIIGLLELINTIFVSLILFPISTFSFGIEFSVIVSFLFWVAGMVLIPARMPELLKRPGYHPINMTS